MLRFFICIFIPIWIASTASAEMRFMKLNNNSVVGKGYIVKNIGNSFNFCKDERFVYKQKDGKKAIGIYKINTNSEPNFIDVYFPKTRGTDRYYYFRINDEFYHQFVGRRFLISEFRSAQCD